MDQSKIIRKIKNLLDLTRSDSEAEASTALAKTKSLMEKHGIKHSDLLASDIKEAKAFACRGQRPPDYLAVLADGICKLFDCTVFNSSYYDFNAAKYGGYVDEFIFVGFDPNQEVCKYCYDVLSRQLKETRKKYLKDLPNYGNRPSRADNFALGWSLAVFEKVRMLVPPKETVHPDEKALVRTDMLQKHIEKKTQNKIKPKKTKGSYLDQYKGFQAGQKVQLNKGMDFRPKTMIG